MESTKNAQDVKKSASGGGFGGTDCSLGGKFWSFVPKCTIFIAKSLENIPENFRLRRGHYTDGMTSGLESDGFESDGWQGSYAWVMIYDICVRENQSSTIAKFIEQLVIQTQ